MSLILRSFYQWELAVTDMKKFWVVVAILSKIMYVDNRMIPLDYLSDNAKDDVPLTPTPTPKPEYNRKDFPNTYEMQRKLIAEEEDSRKYVNLAPHEAKKKKPCSVVVLSNVQNPNTQSLLRRYRYDSNGILIPSSVKYFIKVPRGSGSSPILVPLNDKAFTPLGGFVRYYKEVPPIPQSW